MADEEEVPLGKMYAKIAARRAKEQEALKAEQDSGGWAADLIPDTAGPETKRDLELDAVIGGIKITRAYEKWFGKIPSGRHTGESIKMSCPLPDHPDNDPSAWMNGDTNLWNCMPCNHGGDVYDFAAIHFGFDLKTYKIGANFHELRRKIAEDFGYTFREIIGEKKPVLVAPVTEKDLPTELPETAVEIEDEPEDEDDVTNTLDWQSLIKPDSFLEKYMECCAPDDTPDEYNFWNGLLAISLAVGRDVTLVDKRMVLGNLFVCLLGPTGDGKSRSFGHLADLLSSALPYDRTDDFSKGAGVFGSIASAEALIQQFDKPIYDPTDAKRVKIICRAPVRGIIEFNELSALIGKGRRVGNVILPTLMEFYDGNRVIRTVSTTSGERKAENAFACAFTTTQPNALRNLLDEADKASGMLNRWIFASGTPKRQIAIGGAEVDVEPAVKPLQNIRGWSGLGKKIEWSREANERFTEFFDKTLLPTKRTDRSGILNRIDLLAKKLILLLCINEREAIVPVQIVEKVISMTPYILRSYGIIVTKLAQSLESDLQADILRLIKEKHTSGGISGSNIVRYLNSKPYGNRQVRGMLSYLAEMGVIYVETLNTNKRGPKPTRYFLGD